MSVGVSVIVVSPSSATGRADGSAAAKSVAMGGGRGAAVAADAVELWRVMLSWCEGGASEPEHSRRCRTVSGRGGAPDRPR
jgi:hypothetical protein